MFLEIVQASKPGYKRIKFLKINFNKILVILNKFFNKFYFHKLFYSQKWLNLLVDDRHKIEKKKKTAGKYYFLTPRNFYFLL